MNKFLQKYIKYFTWSSKKTIDKNCLYAIIHRLSEIAQSVEQVTVNHWVAGSSPVLGDIL